MIGTPWDTGGDAPVTSVNGYGGDVVLTAGDVGADPEGAGIAAVGDHLGEADPHPQYQLRSEIGVPNGYANLDPSGFVLQDPVSASATPTANAIAKADDAGTLDAWISPSSETTPGLVQLATDAEAAGDKAVTATDSRLSNARDPNSHAISHQHDGDDEIATSSPAPNAIPKASDTGKLDAWITAASTSAPGLVQLAADAESASNKVVVSNDSRLANARAPTSHATSHQHGGTDEVATGTPAPNAIPKASGTGKLDAWITAASTSAPGLVQLAADAESASNKVVVSNDSRLANARAPTSHATSHQHGGTDEIATASAAGNAIPKANTGGHLDSGWGGAASSLATLDSSTLVPVAQLGTGTANSTKFLRGDRSWATALVGGLGSTDNALLRADGTGGLTGQGSSASLDDSNNLTLGNRSLNQPISPSAWSGASTNHDLPIPSWATTTGRYFSLVHVRVQQNATTSSFQARSHQVELTYNGSAWSIDATNAGPSVGSLPTTTGWTISGGTNLRMSLTGMGGANSGNVGLVFEQFVYLGAL